MSPDSETAQAERPLFLQALDRVVTPRPPIWLMRQAGRYLPEYRAVRSRMGSFLDLCYNPDAATEVTLQPIRRFGFDASILFSDILVVPHALGQAVAFLEGEGPKLDPVTDEDGLLRLATEIDLERLAPVFQTIRNLKGALPSSVPLIGFCGAPWTVASYMIAGKGTPDQAPIRLVAYRNAEFLSRLIDRVVEASITYLGEQIEAGVDAIQIFESFAGSLPPGLFPRWSVDPIRRIVEGLRARHRRVPVIVFARGAGARAGLFAEGIAEALGVDWATDPADMAAAVPSSFPLQGNLDPLALVAGGDALDHAIDSVVKGFAGRPHIFNLGHGILPETPIAHVELLVARLRGEA